VSQLENVLRGLADCLREMRLPWALIGGLAVSVRTEPRFTRDIDISVAVPDDAAAEDLIRQFRSRGFRAEAIVEQEAMHRLATVRLLPPGMTPGLIVDLLFASSGIEHEVCAEADVLEVFPQLMAPVATSAHLLALKVLARDDAHRPQDAADIRQLLAGMDDAAIARARDACRLIQIRGFHRDRDLQQALETALREFRLR
jgi:predicted nucleotidyltransferase